MTKNGGPMLHYREKRRFENAIIFVSLGSPPVARTKNRPEQRRGNGASGSPSFCHPVVSRSAFMPDATIVTALKLILTWTTTRSHRETGETRKRRSTVDSYSLPPGYTWSLNRYTERIDVHARVIFGTDGDRSRRVHRTSVMTKFART